VCGEPLSQNGLGRVGLAVRVLVCNSQLVLTVHVVCLSKADLRLRGTAQGCPPSMRCQDCTERDTKCAAPPWFWGWAGFCSVLYIVVTERAGPWN